MNEDMSDLMNNLNNMLKNNEIPDEIKNFINNFDSSSSNKYNTTENTNTTDFPDIDINTILKLKSIMDSMNNSKNDPRSNLLISLKPYLRENKRDKVDQYIKLFGLSKIIEVIGPNGLDGLLGNFSKKS